VPHGKNVNIKVHRRIISHESETQVTHGSKACEDRVLRGMFALEREEVTAGASSPVSVIGMNRDKKNDMGRASSMPARGGHNQVR
jgi:hypothetical protein